LHRFAVIPGAEFVRQQPVRALPKDVDEQGVVPSTPEGQAVVLLFAPL
jgi:hypothetical protein